MEYRGKSPVTKPKRRQRRRTERKLSRERQEQNRRRAVRGGQPNELGITQGQNAEQGNTLDPRNAQPIGQHGSE